MSRRAIWLSLLSAVVILAIVGFRGCERVITPDSAVTELKSVCLRMASGACIPIQPPGAPVDLANVDGLAFSEGAILPGEYDGIVLTLAGKPTVIVDGEQVPPDRLDARKALKHGIRVDGHFKADTACSLVPLRFGVQLQVHGWSRKHYRLELETRTDGVELLGGSCSAPPEIDCVDNGPIPLTVDVVTCRVLRMSARGNLPKPVTEASARAVVEQLFAVLQADKAFRQGELSGETVEMMAEKLESVCTDVLGIHCIDLMALPYVPESP